MFQKAGLKSSETNPEFLWETQLIKLTQIGFPKTLNLFTLKRAKKSFPFV